MFHEEVAMRPGSLFWRGVIACILLHGDGVATGDLRGE
jgi:hypothetical protein